MLLTTPTATLAPDLDPSVELHLDHAADPHHWHCAPPQLHRELDRLEHLLVVARQHPRLWQQAIAGREQPLALWLFGVALGVAQWGCGDTALLLLEALPGVPGAAGGRGELLREILDCDNTCAELRAA